MSFLSIAQLAEHQPYRDRLRACLTVELRHTPHFLQADQLGWSLMWPVAASPGFGAQVDTQGPDSITDSQILAAVQPLIPAALLANDGLNNKLQDQLATVFAGMDAHEAADA